MFLTAAQANRQYLSVSIPSYPQALTRGWIDAGGVYPDLTPDQRIQAVAFDALFRELSTNDRGIDGVFAYGYWWSPVLYPETRTLRNDLSHSIRLKDAESVFARWAAVLGR